MFFRTFCDTDAKNHATRKKRNVIMKIGENKTKRGKKINVLIAQKEKR